MKNCSQGNEFDASCAAIGAEAVRIIKEVIKPGTGQENMTKMSLITFKEVFLKEIIFGLKS